jgi:hypothetical protein
MLEKDEEELRQELDILDSREIEMFRTLQGNSADEDDPFAELEQIQATIETRRPLAEKNRFKAWLQLMKHFQLPDELFWLASSTDSGDQVIGRFEEKTGGTAVPILRLPLPGRINVSTGYLLKEISAFHEASQQIRREIKDELENLARLPAYDSSSAELLLPGSSGWPTAWETLLEEHFPVSSHYRSEVIIYILPDTRVEDVLELTETAHSSFKHGLLGILKD